MVKLLCSAVVLAPAGWNFLTNKDHRNINQALCLVSIRQISFHRISTDLILNSPNLNAQVSKSGISSSSFNFTAPRERTQVRYIGKFTNLIYQFIKSDLLTNLIISQSSCSQLWYFIMSRHNVNFSYYTLLGFNKAISYREFYSYKIYCKSRCRGFLRDIPQSKHL